jgi:hypothetical protein
MQYQYSQPTRKVRVHKVAPIVNRRTGTLAGFLLTYVHGIGDLANVCVATEQSGFEPQGGDLVEVDPQSEITDWTDSIGNYQRSHVLVTGDRLVESSTGLRPRQRTVRMAVAHDLRDTVQFRVVYPRRGKIEFVISLVSRLLGMDG